MKNFFILFLCGAAAISQDNWTLKKDKEKIKVFVRHVKDSGYLQSRAQAVIDAPASVCMNVLKQVHAHKEWMDKVAESELIQTEGDSVVVFYVRFSAPWPVADRDIIYHYTFFTDSIVIAHVPGEKPKKKGVVRMQDGYGYWTVKSLEHDKTLVTFQYHGDAGGGVPAWLANYGTVDSPFRTLSNLRQRVKRQD